MVYDVCTWKMIKNEFVLQPERPSLLSFSTISELLHSCDRHSSAYRRPMSMPEHLPRSHFFLQSPDNNSITCNKMNKSNILLLFYFKLELPKERHFAILFITTHSVLLILIISKHYRQITYSVRYSKYLFLVYPRNEFFFNEIFAISGNENR